MFLLSCVVVSSFLFLSQIDSQWHCAADTAGSGRLRQLHSEMLGFRGESWRPLRESPGSWFSRSDLETRKTADLWDSMYIVVYIVYKRWRMYSLKRYLKVLRFVANLN